MSGDDRPAGTGAGGTIASGPDLTCGTYSSAMLHHVVLLTLRPDAPPHQRELIVEKLSALPDIIDEVRGYSVRIDAGVDAASSTNADVCIMADFDDVEGYVAYRDHPAHRAVIAEFIAPHLAVRSAAQVI